MSSYHKLGIAAKQRLALERDREPGVRCPWCEMLTPVTELLDHLALRCPGMREPHRLAAWLSAREARELGAAKSTLHRFVARGIVRARRAHRGGHLEYLARDVVLVVAWRRRLAGRPPRPVRFFHGPPPHAGKERRGIPLARGAAEDRLTVDSADEGGPP